jgi:hypothetical protein
MEALTVITITIPYYGVDTTVITIQTSLDGKPTTWTITKTFTHLPSYSTDAAHSSVIPSESNVNCMSASSNNVIGRADKMLSSVDDFFDPRDHINSTPYTAKPSVDCRGCARPYSCSGAYRSWYVVVPTH